MLDQMAKEDNTNKLEKEQHKNSFSTSIGNFTKKDDLPNQTGL